MKVNLAVDPQVGEILKQVMDASLVFVKDVGPLPEGKNLFSFAMSGNPLFGDMTVTMSASPDLVDWVGKAVSKMGGIFNPPAAMVPHENT